MALFTGVRKWAIGLALMGALAACDYRQIPVSPPEPKGPRPPSVRRIEDDRLAGLVERCGADKAPFERDIGCPQGIARPSPPLVQSSD